MEESPKERRVKNNGNHEVTENKKVKFQVGREVKERSGETKD